MAEIAPLAPDAGRRRMLWAMVAAFALISASLAQLVLRQTAGADFSCFWAGAVTALHAPGRLYDFVYVTGLQGWPLGPNSLRPYIYPPSALLVFIPFAVVPYWIGYGLWVVATGALFFLAGVRAKAPWWFVLLPSMAFVAYSGQITFLIGGLILGGLALKHRPVLAGVLFGIAATVKPQMLILLPFALMAEGGWRTIIATAATGAVLVGASAVVWGLQPWLDWLPALGRFQHVIFDSPELLADAITPYAAIVRAGGNGAWGFLLAPIVAAVVWIAFRRDTSLADRSIALLGGALLVSPYAMNYELALLAPAAAIYLAKIEDRRWPAFVVAVMIYVGAPPAIGLLAALALPVLRLAPWPLTWPAALRMSPRRG